MIRIHVGAKVYIAAKNETEADGVVKDLKTRTKSDKIFCMKCDLTSFKSIESFVDAFKKSKYLFTVIELIGHWYFLL